MKNLLFLAISLLLVSCGQDDGWTPLFNGKNLEGWHVFNKGKENYNGWSATDGVLVFNPSERTEAWNADLVTDREFTSFELELEWMISEKGNSGLFWSVVEDEKYQHTYETGPEIQVLDDNWKEYVSERGDIQRAGSIFNLLAPSSIVSKPAGEWNHYVLHIDHTNNEGFVIFNGTKTLEFPVNGPEWEAMIAQSGFKDSAVFGRARTGHIALQDHGGQVAYRNIRVREL